MPGTSPHNCGGGYVMKAYVKDNIIVAIGPDNRPNIPLIDEKAKKLIQSDLMDDPRSIPCIKVQSPQIPYVQFKPCVLSHDSKGGAGQSGNF